MPAPRKRNRRPALNLTVENEIKAGGARAAWRRGKSLSGLVEDYLKSLIAADEAADKLAAPVVKPKKRRG